MVIDEYLNDDFYDVEVVDSLPSTSTYLKENQSSLVLLCLLSCAHGCAAGDAGER